jgi:hypothetical protein
MMPGWMTPARQTIKLSLLPLKATRIGRRTKGGKYLGCNPAIVWGMPITQGLLQLFRHIAI